ncbi:hypothetical protein [Paenibacillus amylolyticus]|uniref:Uncharacterized protein n=1 Tax=Paenibacillus amylolyticus TaxID=1451 RepID=A0ABD8B2Y0_PAEAM
MSSNEERKELQEKEDQLLRVTVLGDIREDAEFLGLTLTDIVWIVINTLVWGFLMVYVFPFSIWFKGIWIALVFVFNLVGRMKKWPYRRKRFIRYIRQKRNGDVAAFIEQLGTEEDSWIYRNKNNKRVHIVASMGAMPWNTSLYKEKQNRIQEYEMFLRSLVMEGFTASVTSETVPDFRHDFWEQKRHTASVNDGIKMLRNGRIDLWEDLANAGEAKRSEYTVTLSIDEKNVSTIEQDEEDQLSNSEKKRNRFMTELRQKKERIFVHLERSGHDVNILSGFAVPEILSRWLHNKAWEEWKVSGGGWEEESDQHEADHESTDTKVAKLHERFAQMISRKQVDETAVSKEELNGTLELSDKDTSETPEDTVETALRAIPTKGEVNRKRPLNAILGLFKRILVLRKKEKISNEDASSDDLIEQEEQESVHITESKNEKKPIRDLLLNLNVLKLKVKWFERSRKATIIEPVRHSDPDEIALESSSNQKDVVPLSVIPNAVTALTSKGSTGTTFLASNLAVSTSLSGYRTVLIDLSPDRGTLTVLNPKKVSTSEGWENWETRHSPEQLEIKIPGHYPTFEEIVSCIDAAAVDSIVIIDVPWGYPDRPALEEKYGLVAVLDCDYHHWLQFELSNSEWSGRFWLNQTDETMTKFMSQLIKERYSKEFYAITPYYTNANKSLYQGRPLTLDPELRSIFCEHMMEVTSEQC